MADLVLLPYPRALTMAAGHYALAPNRRIVLEGAPPAALLGAGRRLQAALAEVAALDWDVAASALGPADAIGAVLRVAPGSLAHAQGYELTITPEQIVVVAATPAGVFYGVCTLVQILQQAGRALPALHIADWPDFAVRGILLDISRDKVPQMATLYALIDMLAGWKLNQVQLYTEHTFAYHQHPDVWAQASPITGDEILALDDFCRARHVELVPNQNSFGHMHRWLIHDRYAPLAETPGEFQVPWGTMPGPFSLCPEDPGSLALVRSLYDELLPHFSSRLVNVGCDETFDLGQGRSREAVRQRGVGRVYLDFLLAIQREIAQREHTMLFWGDIVLQHPELVPEIPAETIALEWGYEATHPFDQHAPIYAAAGVPFYVCPGTSSWCSVAGRTANAIANLRQAAEHGLHAGASGYMITDWGDRGHWQALPISYLGLACGAAASWGLSASQAMDVARTISLHAFRDPAGILGRIVSDLGDIYRQLGPRLPNSSLLFWILQLPLAS